MAPASGDSGWSRLVSRTPDRSSSGMPPSCPVPGRRPSGAEAEGARRLGRHGRLGGQRLGGGDQAGHVDAVRRRVGVRLDPARRRAAAAWSRRSGCRGPGGSGRRRAGRAPATGRARPSGAAFQVPSSTSWAWNGRPASISRCASASDSSRRQHQVVGHPFDALGVVRQRPAEPVARPGVAGPAGRVAVARTASPGRRSSAALVLGDGSSSQSRSTVVNADGSSSCGK